MSCASLQNSYLNTSGSAPAVAFQTLASVGASIYNQYQTLGVPINGGDPTEVPQDGTAIDLATVEISLPASNVPVAQLTYNGIFAPGSEGQVLFTIVDNAETPNVLATSGTYTVSETSIGGSNIAVLAPIPFSITAIGVPVADAGASNVATWSVKANPNSNAGTASEVLNGYVSFYRSPIVE